MTTGKTIILLAGVLIAAFLGMLGATEYLEWRKHSRFQKKIGGLEKGESTSLRQGLIFPDIELVGLDGTSINSQKLSENVNVLYLFLSIGCDPCTEAVQSWVNAKRDIPGNVRIYGLCEDDVDYTKVYVTKTGFPYPVFCDTAHVLSTRYDMNVYPSAVGVRQDGTIAFVKHGIGKDFSPFEESQNLIKSD